MPHIVRWHWEVSNKYRSPYISITKPAGFFCGPYLGLTLEKCDFWGWFLCIILAIWLIVQKSQGQPTWDASSPGKQWDFNYQPQLPSKWLFLRFFFFPCQKRRQLTGSRRSVLGTWHLLMSWALTVPLCWSPGSVHGFPSPGAVSSSCRCKRVPFGDYPPGN